MNLLLLATVALLLASGCHPPETVDDPGNEIAPITPSKENVAFFVRPVLLARLRLSTSPEPEIVLLERDPWGSVIGSDSPSFALYRDGTVIYQDELGFRSIRLDQSEVHDLRMAIRGANKPQLGGQYEVALATDQPSNSLLIYGDDPVFISVYGSLDDERISSRLPPEVSYAFTKIRSFGHLRAASWLPDKIEIMIWPYEHAPDPSVSWPEGWPDLDDANTVKRGVDSYSIFLPSDKLSDVRALRTSRSERGAIEINGRKWSTSIRFPFPSEELWMAPNLEAQEPQ
ncbi:MAG: hypothetical protein ABJK59_09000 [Erythrobacter sp.]|uniref:hypothetical protein n=1 Tax=Erythrobacter sp. TaxID=1042 RepID=UPI003297FB13